MAEADELCDRIAIVDRAIGTPDELKRRVQRESIFRLEVDRLDGGIGALDRLPGVVSAVAGAAPDLTASSEGRSTVAVNVVGCRTTRPLVAWWVPWTEWARRFSRFESPNLASRTSSWNWWGGALATRTRAGATGGGPRLGIGSPRQIRSADVSARVHRAAATPRDAARWSRRRELAVNLRSVLGRAYLRVIGGAREPSWILFEILLPFLTTSAFVFVYRALPPSSGGRRTAATWSSISRPRSTS
ncbi:MAG: hypothetical protein M3301_10175 [Chloroflexota bacterium]|nr:hypothetical protein [Chloroflexota bacterium]